jgi:hypothetical protein
LICNIFFTQKKSYPKIVAMYRAQMIKVQIDLVIFSWSILNVIESRLHLHINYNKLSCILVANQNTVFIFFMDSSAHVLECTLRALANQK